VTGDEEIKVALTADYSDLQEGMDASAESVTEASQTMESAVAESAAVITKSYEDIIAAQNRNMQQTSASIAAESSASSARTTTAAAIDVETVATTENTAAMAINGGVARELGVLLGEGLRGNFARMEGSAITLSNRLGLMQAIMSPLGLTIAATAGAAIGFAAEIMKGEEQSDAFNKALINSGGILAVTEGQFNTMAESLRSTDTTIGTAREAMMDFAQSGKIGGAQLQSAGQAAVDFAALTGTSMDKAVAAIVKIEEDPVKALKQLNDEYHFLTLAQLDHIQKLEDEGDKTAAVAEAIKLFGTVNTNRLAAADTDVGTLVQWWRSLKGAISDAGDEVQAFGRKQTLEDQIEQVTKSIADAKAGYTELGTLFGKKIDIANPFHPMIADTSLLEEKLASLEKQAGDGRFAASQKAAAQATQDAAIAAGVQNDAVLKGMKGTSEYTTELDKELAALKAIHEANADDSRVKNIDFDSGGNASGGAGLAKIEDYLHKKYDVKAKAGESEHKLDEQQLQQEEADQGIGYSDRLKFEMNFWQQKLETATKGSKEYAQVFAQVQNLEKQYDAQSAAEADKAAKEKLKSQLEALDQAKAAYDQDTETQKQQLQLQFDNGSINASKLASLEMQLVQKKLAADVAYLSAKETLDRASGASGVDAANKEAAAIEAVKSKAAQDMIKIEQKQIVDSEKQWTKYSEQIAGAWKTGINAMIFQGQTLKSSMASIGETMAEDFIEAAIEKPLEKWIAAEASKLFATIGTLTGQSTATNTARAADSAAESVASLASVARASGVAGAMGTASFAGAPWPVDMGAPAFGAAMALSAMSYGTVASAAGGWGDIPSDQLAMVHKNEMILPAHIAQGVRDMSSGGNAGSGGQGGGDTHHWHISTMDGRSTEHFFRNNMTALAKAVKTKTQNSAQVRR
jgi:hypothetical protein